MAVATFPERIQDDLTLLVADKTLIDLSNQRDSDTNEDSARTLRVCQMAAANIERKLGDVGLYDDTDGTIGDLEALDLGVRLALYRYATSYTLKLTAAGQEVIGTVLEELEDLAKSRRQENSTPVIGIPDNDGLNARHSSSVWADDDDT